MRSASSYRGARKAIAREVGLPLASINKAFNIAARAAEAAPAGTEAEAARKKLAIWAANGGRETAISPPSDLVSLNALSLKPAPAPEATVEQATKAAAKLTAADVDRAMEAALSKHQASGAREPLVLSRLFAARARLLGWVEDVEFVEERE